MLSVYLNLDPSEFPTQRDRKIEVESLLDVAERALREDGLPASAEGRAEAGRGADPRVVRRASSTPAAPAGWRCSPPPARTCSTSTASRGRCAARSTIDDSPFIEPLAGMPGDDGYGVLLINRKVARILAGGADRMREVISFADDVHRWHDQGGWSQSRFQRGIEKEVKDHLKHANDELFKLFKRGVVQRLIIGCPDEMRGEVEHTLHSYLRERIAGWLDIDVRARPAEVAQRGGRDHRARRARPRAPLARPAAGGAGAQRARRGGPGRHARGAQRAARRGAAGGRRLPRRGLRLAAGGLPVRRAGQLPHG